jgi:DNA-binding GntR family transcriptional regulator
MRLPPITPELPAVNRPFSRSIRAPRAPGSYAAFRLFYGEEPPTLSIKDQVAVAVAERIVEGRFAPGERIPEQLIADEFNVSKAPVSEALMLLEYAGLVESAARRSAYVPQMSVQDFEDLAQYRAALARVALLRFFDQHKPADREVMRGYMIGLDAIVDDEGRGFEFVELFDRSSLYTFVQAGNRRVTRAAFPLSLQTLRYFRLGGHGAKQRRVLLALWKRAAKALGGRDRKDYLAACEEIQQTRNAETLAALQAAQ